MERKITIIDNFLDPPMHDAFDFCTRYYESFKYGRTSVDYDRKDSTDSRYFSKVVYNGTPDPMLQRSFANPGEEIFYRYVCGKLKEKWLPFFTFDSTKFFIESTSNEFGLWIFDIHINFRSTGMTDQWHRDASVDTQAGDIRTKIPNWNKENVIDAQQFTINLFLGDNFEEDETGLEIEEFGLLPWKGNVMAIFPSELEHKVYFKPNFTSKEMRLTYTAFGILIQYRMDKENKEIPSTLPTTQRSPEGTIKPDYSFNIERNKLKPNLYKT